MNDLLQLFIFAQTPLEELRAWLAATPHRFERFAPGERIIAQGAECRSALLLTAGKANTEMVQDGRDLSIDVLVKNFGIAGITDVENDFKVFGIA